MSTLSYSILQCIAGHLETNCICDAQHDFRKNHSCKTQLIIAVILLMT